MGSKVNKPQDLWNVFRDGITPIHEQKFEMLTSEEYERIKKIHGIN